MNYKEVLKCLKMPNYVSNDFYSMLFARSIGGTAGYGELTGTPPLTFTANGRNLINYRIYGANDGVGEQTENLFDYTTMAVSAIGYYLNATGQEKALSGWRISDYIPCNGKKFTINRIGGTTPAICLYDANKQFLSGKSYQASGVTDKISVTISSATNAGYIRFSYIPYWQSKVSDDLSQIVVTEGSTAPAQYIPFGYQINAEVGDSGTTTNIPIYIGDTPLAQGEYADYGEQKVYKRTDNLFDKNAAIDGYEIVSTGISVNANWYISDFIPVRPNVKYKASAISNSVLLYKSKDDQSPVFRNGIVTSGGFLVPDGYNFIVVNANKNVSKDIVMLTELSEFPAEYIPYLQPQDPPVELPALPTIDGETIVDFDNAPKPSEMYIKYPK